MSYFAKVPTIVNGKGIVQEVIKADQDFISSGLVGDPSLWIQTSYNTRGGVYYLPDSNTPDSDQSKALRANYAGIGYTYDSINNVFYAPQPYPSWTISAPTWIWTPPIAMPSDGKAYAWNESTKTWDVVVIK
jgi:hypothetical protein